MMNLWMYYFMNWKMPKNSKNYQIMMVMFPNMAKLWINKSQSIKNNQKKKLNNQKKKLNNQKTNFKKYINEIQMLLKIN